jgi:hypothetical protein
VTTRAPALSRLAEDQSAVCGYPGCGWHGNLGTYAEHAKLHQPDLSAGAGNQTPGSNAKDEGRALGGLNNAQLPGRDLGLPAPPAGEFRTATADPLLTAVPVTGTMPAGHYSRSVHPANHAIRYVTILAFTGPSHAQYTTLSLQCSGCHDTRSLGDNLSLADLMRGYAQHAGRKALALEVATVLAAIAENGSDR